MSNEQLRRYLDTHTIKDKIIKRTKKTIEKMEQHRNSLIKEVINYDEHRTEDPGRPYCRIKRT